MSRSPPNIIKKINQCAWAASVNAPASFNKWKLTGAIGICYGLDKIMELYGLGVPLCDDLYTTYDLRLVTVEIFLISI